MHSHHSAAVTVIIAITVVPSLTDCCCPRPWLVCILAGWVQSIVLMPWSVHGHGITSSEMTLYVLVLTTVLKVRHLTHRLPELVTQTGSGRGGGGMRQ